MESLNLPAYDVATTERDGKEHIYDPLRKRYVKLTPEEWVRQHFAHYLIHEHNVPAGLVGVETRVELQGRPQRADLIVHDRQGEPLLLVECKAPRVSIGQDTFDQCARYNLVLGAPYLVVTNGLTHYACEIDFENRDYRFLEEVPSYDELTGV